MLLKAETVNPWHLLSVLSSGINHLACAPDLLTERRIAIATQFGKIERCSFQLLAI